MRQVVIANLAALFAMATLSASAQAPAQSDPKLAAAMDYLEASNAKEHVMTMVDAMEQVVLPQIRRQHPNADPAAISALEKAMREEMAASIDDYIWWAPRRSMRRISRSRNSTRWRLSRVRMSDGNIRPKCP